jgi:hypothetical protein
MLSKLSRRLTYANVMSTIAVFGVLAGGTAYAANTVFSADIVDGEVKSVDVGDNEIGSADVKDNSINTFDVHSFLGVDVVDDTLTGADVNESTLGTVPSSVLGGLGRSGVRPSGQAGLGLCNPETSTFINCDMIATLTLSKPARVLVLGSVRIGVESGAIAGTGECQVGTTSGAVPGTIMLTALQNDPDTGLSAKDHMATSGVTGVFPAGQHSFGIDCRDLDGGSAFDQAKVTAVALSDQ